MKAIHKFNLPEDQEEYNRANKALDMAGVLWDFDQYLRAQQKYADKPDDINQIRDKFHETMSSHNVDLDELYK